MTQEEFDKFLSQSVYIDRIQDDIKLFNDLVEVKVGEIILHILNRLDDLEKRNF